jgi:gluconolactonase
MNYEGHKAPFELPTQVYRLDPNTGEATAVADDMKRPNGLCFSPEESRLYIVDTGVLPQVIRIYDVGGGPSID